MGISGIFTDLVAIRIAVIIKKLLPQKCAENFYKFSINERVIDDFCKNINIEFYIFAKKTEKLTLNLTRHVKYRPKRRSRRKIKK